jgi:hypothetical protein
MTVLSDYNRLRCCATNAINSVTSIFSCHANDCMCRSNRMPSAIFTLVSMSCGNDRGATSAMGVYISYCRANGYDWPLFANVTVPSPEGECNKNPNSSKSLISLLVSFKGTVI